MIIIPFLLGFATCLYRYWHRWNAYATHQPILRAAVKATSGPVLELGCGECSTPMLHRLCAKQNRHLHTAENDSEYFERFSECYGTLIHRSSFYLPPHSFELVYDWRETAMERARHEWSVVFVDNGPTFADRVLPIEHLADSTEFLVIHDCDAVPFDWARFKWSKVFLSPWGGPPTMLASNKRNGL